MSLNLYLQVKERRRYPNLPVFWWRRQPLEQWQVTRQHIHQRDRGFCQSPTDSPPKNSGLCMGEIELKTAHIDHIRPLSEYGLFRYHTAAAIAPLLSLKSREKAMPKAASYAPSPYPKFIHRIFSSNLSHCLEQIYG